MKLDVPIHYTFDTGHLEPHYDTPCGLGDSRDRGFYRGSDDWDIVTCKNCIKFNPNTKHN